MNFDVRVPLSLMFIIVGCILAVFGFLTREDVSLYTPCLHINLNWAWGVIMMLFGIGVLFLGLGQRWAHNNRKINNAHE